MKEEFIPRKFNPRSLALITKANQIIDHYRTLGYRLTLRQVYYQLVTANVIPNNLNSYKNLASLLNDARLAGLVDWAAIEDRNRETVHPNTWDSPSQILRAVANQYREDLWQDQPYLVEVMAEKDAVSNILQPVAIELGVGFTANRGYPSASLLYEVAQRVERATGYGKNVAILYFGDHDPSGLDMDRDILARTGLLSHESIIEFERIALTRDQVDFWNPPPNPAKPTDSRYAEYRREHGPESWELDAIKAEDLAQLVRDHITHYIDPDLWDVAKAHQDHQKAKLARVAKTIDEDYENEED